MYTTIKIPLYINNMDKKELQEYEEIYHHQIEEIVAFFKLSQHASTYPYIDMDNRLAYHSKHNILKIACHLYEMRLKDEKSFYKKSSTWNKQSFRIRNNLLILEYGSAHHKKRGYYRMAMDTEHMRKLKRGEMIRLDIMHEYDCWYANITVKVNDLIHKNVVKQDEHSVT